MKQLSVVNQIRNQYNLELVDDYSNFILNNFSEIEYNKDCTVHFFDEKKSFIIATYPFFYLKIEKKEEDKEKICNSFFYTYIKNLITLNKDKTSEQIFDYIMHQRRILQPKELICDFFLNFEDRIKELINNIFLNPGNCPIFVERNYIVNDNKKFIYNKEGKKVKEYKNIIMKNIRSNVKSSNLDKIQKYVDSCENKPTQKEISEKTNLSLRTIKNFSKQINFNNLTKKSKTMENKVKSLNYSEAELKNIIEKKQEIITQRNDIVCELAGVTVIEKYKKYYFYICGVEIECNEIAVENINLKLFGTKHPELTY